MPKHTPGPWVKDYNGTKGHIKAIINKDERMTPTVARYDIGLWVLELGSTQEEEEANAYLITAAPDLLEACENSLELFARMKHEEGADGFDSVIEELERVIAKARRHAQ